MALIKCKTHGETGLIPTVSKSLADSISANEVTKSDIKVIYVKVYDDDDFLFEKTYFLHASLDVSDFLQENITINDDESDRLFSLHISSLFLGGGYCVKCFKDYMDKIGFDLATLKAPSGIIC